MFTKCLISTIDEAALEKFGDYSKFSRVAWAGYKNQAGTWRAIRNPRKNGKARAIYAEDLICISNALEIPLSELFFRVEQRLNMGWQPTQEVCSTETTTIKPVKKAAGSDSELPSEKEDVA